MSVDLDDHTPSAATTLGLGTTDGCRRGGLVPAVYGWPMHGKGPVAYRFGKHLKFAVSDVLAWMAEQREPSDRR
jgi:hypothetical protein